MVSKEKVWIIVLFIKRLLLLIIKEWRWFLSPNFNAFKLQNRGKMMTSYLSQFLSPWDWKYNFFTLIWRCIYNYCIVMILIPLILLHSKENMQYPWCKTKFFFFLEKTKWLICLASNVFIYSITNNLYLKIWVIFNSNPIYT